MTRTLLWRRTLLWFMLSATMHEFAAQASDAAAGFLPWVHPSIRSTGSESADRSELLRLRRQRGSTAAKTARCTLEAR